VRQAFVYLEGIPSEFSDGPVRARVVTEIEQKDCAYGPHAMTLAAGDNLEIVNHDPILHNVNAKQITADGLRTIFNIAQPLKGQRTKLEAPLNTPGIVRLSCEAGHPWMSAYILVADHPFVATTDTTGSFVLSDVPAGTYPLRMWHEGVRLTRVIPSLQQYEYEAPYELTQDVVVPPDGEAVVNFVLELRKLG
jgi:plastocyanin